jgi:hypothetical protein
LDKVGRLGWQNIVLDVSSRGRGLNILDEIIGNTLYARSIQGGEGITIKQSKDRGLVIDVSMNIMKDGKLSDTDIYYDNGRVGIGRKPLYTYMLDIAVPKNKVMTSLHFGDGSCGFSLGNGTLSGFIPEIIGMGSDEDDAGLYFLGVTNNDEGSVPLVIIDGRTKQGQLKNRPILGITNCSYDDYRVLVDNMGNVTANDFLINNISLYERIKNLEQELQKLKTHLDI